MKKAVAFLGVGAVLPTGCSAFSQESPAPIFSCVSEQVPAPIDVTGEQTPEAMLIAGIAKAIDDCYNRAPSTYRSEGKPPYSRNVMVPLARGVVEFSEQFSQPPAGTFDTASLKDVTITTFGNPLTTSNPTIPQQQIDFLRHPEGWSVSWSNPKTGEMQAILPDTSGELYAATPSGVVRDQRQLDLMFGQIVGQAQGLLREASN